MGICLCQHTSYRSSNVPLAPEIGNSRCYVIHPRPPNPTSPSVSRRLSCNLPREDRSITLSSGGRKVSPPVFHRTGRAQRQRAFRQVVSGCREWRTPSSRHHISSFSPILETLTREFARCIPQSHAIWTNSFFHAASSQQPFPLSIQCTFEAQSGSFHRMELITLKYGKKSYSMALSLLATSDIYPNA